MISHIRHIVEKIYINRLSGKKIHLVILQAVGSLYMKIHSDCRNSI